MMLLRPLGPPWRSKSRVAAVRQFTSTARLARVSLAYERHEPPKQNAYLPEGRPVVFIHGLFGSSKNNRSMSRALARDLNCPVYAIDTRNHGKSEHDPRHDYSALAEDLEGFIEDHVLGQTTLIGHSMGAKIAMTVALHNPSVVANLIAVDNAPVDAALKSDFGKYIQGMKKVEEAKIHKQSEADLILQPYEDSLPIRQFLLTNLERSVTSDPSSPLKFRIPLKILGSSLDHMADFPYKDPDEVRFEKPTLFVRGTRSHYVSDETLPIIGRFFPMFEVEDVEAGHWVISENPHKFKEVVLDFLRDKS